MTLLDIASIPDVGSSKNTTNEPPINAIASDNFLLLPPLNALIIFFLSDYNIVVSIIYSISLIKS